MKITKVGHCCLLIEINGARILTDPGSFTTGQDELIEIDAVLITHEHQDHFHIPSLRAILKLNPQTKIIANEAVAKILESEQLPYTRLQDRENISVKEVLIEAFEAPHAIVYKTLPRVRNSGFLIHKTVFLPGDALINPHRQLSVLALPIAGPWIKVSESIDYAKDLKPKYWFPVHDMVLSHDTQWFTTMMIDKLVSPEGLQLIPHEIGKPFSVEDTN